MPAQAGDPNSELGLCAMCGTHDPPWRTFGRAHSWTADRVELIEHLYCDAHEAYGRLESSLTGRRFEARPRGAAA